MVVRFLVLFTIIIIIGTVSILGVTPEDAPPTNDTSESVYAKYMSPDPASAMISDYLTMLFSVLGMWSLVLGLRWAITGKWRLWGKKK